MGERGLDRLDAVLVLSGGAKDIALVGAGVAETHFLNFPAERAVRTERQLSGAAKAAGFWRELRQLEKFAAVGRDEEAVTRLERAAELPEGSHIVSGIEDKNSADFWRREDGRQRRIFQIVGKTN